MASLPLQRFLLSIDFNCYVGTRLSTKGASDAEFRLLHVYNVVPALVILCRTGQHIVGTEGDTEAAALTPLSINYYGSFWHVCAWSGSVLKVCRRSTVLPDRESATGRIMNCLWRFANVLCTALVYVSGSRAPTSWLRRSNDARDFSLIVAQVKSDSVRAPRIKLSRWCSHG
jgi:hypothetical protein